MPQGAYAFGCVDLYRTFEPFAAQRWLQRKLGVCIPLYVGSAGVLPRRVALDLVLGAPLEPRCATPGWPTDAEVVEAHAQYTAALRALFDEHKARFGIAERELLIG